MLGEVDILFYNEKRRYCFMTKKGAELLTLSKKEFRRLIEVEYREIGKQIIKQGLVTLKTWETNYKNTINHLKKRSRAKKTEIKLGHDDEICAKNIEENDIDMDKDNSKNNQVLLFY